MQKRVLIIGAGGVGQVVAHKCALNADVFAHITLASRRESKCRAIAEQIQSMHGRQIDTAEVDADERSQSIALIRKVKPDLLINVALPYQDLALMDACLETGVDYLDTANYEPRDTAKFEYKWQWDYTERFAGKGIMALLGSGFDPGVTNVFTAYSAKHYFDEVHTLDIIDVNGGDHGKPFATNFNPEINIREVSAPCVHYEAKGDEGARGTGASEGAAGRDGASRPEGALASAEKIGSLQRIETPAMSTSQNFTCPDGVGTFRIYRMYHEELESLVKHFPTLRKAQFWMSFSDNYLKHLEVLRNVGMTSIEPIEYRGQSIVPLQFLKAVLPEPSSLGPDTKGQTCIGTILQGTKNDAQRKVYVYNICDHEEAYSEVRSQAISYTTGVPAVIGAKMILSGLWKKPGVYNMEEFDPDPFMEELKKQGLPWKVQVS